MKFSTMHNVFQIFVLLCCFCSHPVFSQSVKEKFSCPVKGGVIKMRRPEEYANRTPSETLNLTSTDGKVYSCSPGVVKAVDRKDSIVSVYVVYKNYFIVYKKLAASGLKEGTSISEGELIGAVDVSKSFWFSIYKDDFPVDPKSILTCEVKRQ